MTCAMIVAVPLIGMTEVAVVSVIVDPDGAVSGTRLQAASIARSDVGSRSSVARRLRDIMKTLTILIPMHLAGQGETARARGTRGEVERGYAMAAFIVGLAVMAVMMTVAMPVWKQMAQREKEEELVFRGEQIAHSIGMFQRRTANAYPPSIDVLVQQKFLRKKYKDPIANDDFVPIPQGRGVQAGTGTQQTGQQGRGQQPGAATPGAAPALAAGIIGVTSKSTDASIRLYKGRSHYNEWAFIYTPPAQTAGGPTGAPGVQGGRGSQPAPNGPGVPSLPNVPGSGGFPGRGGRGNFPPFGGGQGQGQGQQRGR
jgi:type II secretory pathway pseudopilin PulG